MVRPRLCLRTEYWSQRSWRKQVHKEPLDVKDEPFWGQMFDKRDLEKGGWWADRVCVSSCVLCDLNAMRRSVFERCPCVFRIYAHPRIQVHVHRVRDMAYADCFSKCNRIWTEIERLNMYETAHEYNSAEQT